ncbi:ATP-binding protein [Uliginosibacterium sp. sgz301328]|uniref:ATP-binding protein n=1 Tax=Uliginosibacterium sp. sgz301328 TaxID=3243764 RepID=UPI00359EECE6
MEPKDSHVASPPSVSPGDGGTNRRLHRPEEHTEADLREMIRLNEIGNRCVRPGNDMHGCMEAILEAAIEFTGADKGNVQMLDRHTGKLKIIAQRGFDTTFLAFFDTVHAGDGTACAVAMSSGQRAVVEDVMQSPQFRSDTSLRVLLGSGIRAVQSTPLVSGNGAVLGVISTHFLEPHSPSERALRFVDLLARLAADYPERKHAEWAIRESEERFRAFIRATSDVVYRMSADWSEMWYLHGREFIVDTTEPSSSWLGRYIAPEDQPDVMRAIRQAIAAKDVFELEHRVIRIDGTLGWTHSRAVPIMDGAGQIVEWLGTARDISRRKETEHSLRMSELRYRTLFESIDEGYCIIRMLFDDTGAPIDYVFEEVNQSFERQTGIRDGVGRSMRNISPDHESHWYEVYGRIARTGESERFESVAESLHRWFDVYAFRIGEPEEHRVAVLFQDISERKQTEQALRDSEARLRTIVEQLPAGVGVMDGTGKWTVSNTLMERYLPYAAPSGEPGRVPLWRAWNEDGEPILPEDWPGARAMRGETVMPGTQMLYSDANGQELWLRMSATPLRSEAGKVMEACAVAQDITQLKKAEQVLREADRRKDEFLATLSHELRNPLAPIRNGLHILRRNCGNAEVAARVMPMLERQVDHMVRLVDDLMEVSRITGGKIELRKERVELASALRSAVEASSPLIEAAHQRLVIEFPEAPLTVEADPVRLGQIIANLLNNAAKYTMEGGQIWLSAHRDGHDAVISVRDNGMGIPADMLPKIFDLFTQAERTYSRAQGGLGIGLTLVRSLVELHGGRVNAASDGPGKGSVFTVRLPLTDGAGLSAHLHPQASRPDALAGLRVLIVDDNRDAALSLGALLDPLGSATLTIHGGEAALAALATFAPDVIILDIGMPDMDGYEVARRARELTAGKPIALIAVTGWGQDEDRRRSREAGVDYHFVKPVDLEALEALLGSTAAAKRSIAQ